MKTLRKETILLTVLMAMILWSCQNGSKNTGSNLYLNAHKVKVKEVIQATSYTYLNVEENRETFWIAIDKRDIKEGTILYYDDGLEMNNFKSKDLDKTFETIYFVQDISDQPTLPGQQQQMEQQNPMGQMQPQKPTLAKSDVSIQPAEGGISIAALYEKRELYKDKTVRIRGKVVKVNEAIMNRNWIHLQDGSEYEGSYDLTITTDQKARVGDVVTFEGKISLKKDFGAGYSYEVIMEDAILINPI